jgi:hypothetical protein
LLLLLLESYLPEFVDCLASYALSALESPTVV